MGQIWTLAIKPCDNHGECDVEKREIVIDAECANPGSVELHEIIHAILFESGHSARLEHDDEEAMVVALEHGLWLAGYRRQDCDRNG